MTILDKKQIFTKKFSTAFHNFGLSADKKREKLQKVWHHVGIVDRPFCILAKI